MCQVSDEARGGSQEWAGVRVTCGKGQGQGSEGIEVVFGECDMVSMTGIYTMLERCMCVCVIGEDKPRGMREIQGDGVG